MEESILRYIDCRSWRRYGFRLLLYVLYSRKYVGRAMREFRKTTGRGKKPQVWYIEVDPKDPETYIKRWGVLDGALQETADRPGSCGVEGHSDYQTAAEYVKFCMSRDIRKKQEEGYVEYVKGKPVSDVVSIVDFSKPLPKNFCFYKPKLEIADDKLKKLEDAGRAVWTLKRDGMMHLSVKRQNNWEIYSRRMDLVTEKYPHIVEALSRMKVPNGTIFVGEIVLLKDNGADDFKSVSRICRSKEDLSLAYQGLGDFPKGKDPEVLGKVSYYVFDVPFYDSKDAIKEATVGKRLALMRHLFSQLDPKLSVNTGVKANKKQMISESKRREAMLRESFVAPLKIYKTSTGDDLDLARELKAEGFVVLDTDACYGDKGYSFDGKASRPDGIWKRKAKLEDEFIITGVYSGSGRNRNRFGGFNIAQIHPDTGEQIDCGKCGGGFSDEHRDSFLDDSLIGKTIKVEFDSRQAPNKGVYAVRFPVYKAFADKAPEECVAQNLPEED